MLTLCNLQSFFIFYVLGLYGNNGILPVTSLLQSIQEEANSNTAESLFLKTPSLIWFLPFEADIGLEILSILGTKVMYIQKIDCTLLEVSRFWTRKDAILNRW